MPGRLHVAWLLYVAYNKLDNHGKMWADPEVFDAPLTPRGRQQVSCCCSCGLWDAMASPSPSLQLCSCQPNALFCACVIYAAAVPAQCSTDSTANGSLYSRSLLTVGATC